MFAFIAIGLRPMPPGHSEKNSSDKIELDLSGCYSMLEVLTEMKNGKPENEISKKLDAVLDTKPFQAMFKHYNRSWRPTHLPVAIFKQMIMSLRFKNIYTKGENDRADAMLPYWIKFYENIALFSENLNQLKKADIITKTAAAADFAKSWLPPGWDIRDAYLPIIPNGGSKAFAIDSILGYDFFQLPLDSSGNIKINDLLITISHELHHLGQKTTMPQTIKKSSDSAAYTFLSVFVGEGTATKFINNYPGGLVPVADASRDSAFDNAEIRKWWQQYTLEEPALFLRLVSTFEKVYAGSLSGPELQTEISKFWLKGFISPVYFVGSELFGAIYQAYGKEGVFEAMKDFRKLFLLYNNAIKAKPGILGRCYALPDSTIRHAGTIGY